MGSSDQTDQKQENSAEEKTPRQNSVVQPVGFQYSGGALNVKRNLYGYRENGGIGLKSDTTDAAKVMNILGVVKVTHKDQEAAGVIIDSHGNAFEADSMGGIVAEDPLKAAQQIQQMLRFS